MKEIKLSAGMVALVDDSDYEWLMQFKWTYAKGYAAYGMSYRNGTKAFIYMHKLITQIGSSFIVDHINMNPLDNRRENLRVATKAQNGWNCNAPKDNKTGYKGVVKRDLLSGAKWIAQIRCNGKAYYLGLHDTPEAAAKAYDAKALELHGDYARLNFPE